MSSGASLRQRKLEEFFPQSKPGKSEADLLPKLECLQGMNQISTETVASLLRGEWPIPKFVIFDCRFDYEYEGGHIQGAVHATDHDSLLTYLQEDDWETVPIILHCEFSQLRGPTMLKWLRNHDRTQNMENYPSLTYPELYLMQGGYAEFFNTFPDLCTPSHYVPCKQRKVKRALTQISKIHKLL